MNQIPKIVLLVYSLHMLLPVLPGTKRLESASESIQLFENFKKEISIQEVEISRTQVVIGTFLGSEKRNFYGTNAPSRLKEVWRYRLGTGQTRVGSKILTWSGAGWPGQPLLVVEDSIPYLIQGSYDHNLRKINALDGSVVWKYNFDDVIKGTGTIWRNPYHRHDGEEFIILQGSRQGLHREFDDSIIPSYRAISLVHGQELWRLNSKLTKSYSRDVDGSALIVNDTGYIGLENGTFTVFDPSPDTLPPSIKHRNPRILKERPLFNRQDHTRHGGNLVTESSPALLGDHVYVTSGSGHVYGYSISSGEIDWDFHVGSDMDGSPVVTTDSCLLVSIEKQFIKGNGGVLKLDPRKKPSEAVVWFFPTGNVRYAQWNGGVIGSVSVNDHYRKNDADPWLAAFLAIDGYLYVVDHRTVDTSRMVTGFDGKRVFPVPKLLFKFKAGASISTPIIVDNKIIAAGGFGLYLFEFSNKPQFSLLDRIDAGCIEATPIVYNYRIFVASRNGFLYCAGDDSITCKRPETLTLAQNTGSTVTHATARQRSIKKPRQLDSPIASKETESPSDNHEIVPDTEKNGGFHLITGSFTLRTNAERLCKKLHEEGFSASILTGKPGWHMVSIGRFNSRSEALHEVAKASCQLKDLWVLHSESTNPVLY